MKRLLALFLGCNCLEAKSIVTDDFLDKVAMIESNYNYEAVGDKGLARGAWQMHEASWKEACMWLAHRDSNRDFWIEVAGMYKQSASDHTYSRCVANAYLKMLEEQMRKNKIDVTPIKLYMAWNMGFSGAKSYYFNPTSVVLTQKRRSILARANFILSR